MIQDYQTQIQDYQIEIQELQSQILKLRKQPRRNSREPRVSQEKMEASGAAASESSIELRWRKGRAQALCEMYGQVAAMDESRPTLDVVQRKRCIHTTRQVRNGLSFLSVLTMVSV